MAKASLVFYPNRLKKSKKNDLVPIYARFMINGSKSEAYINCTLPEKELDLWDAVTMRIKHKSSHINKTVNKIQTAFDDLIATSCLNLAEFTAHEIRARVLQQLTAKTKEKPATLMTFVEKYYSEEIEHKSSLTIGTKKNYRKAFRHLRNYLTYTKQESIGLKKINLDFAHGFKSYLVCDNEKEGRIGMKEPSAAGIIKKMRTVIEFAKDRGSVNSNPFKKIKLNNKSRRRPKLETIHLKNIYKIYPTLSDSVKVNLDCFLFSVFTGLAYIDAFNLRNSNIIQVDGTEKKLTMHRQKSKIETEQFLLDEALQIIDKYKSQQENVILGYLLPRRSNKTINLALKYVAEKAEIPFPLTHHIARHTFRQLLFEAEIHDGAIVNRIFGKSNYKSIDDIYYNVSEKSLLQAKIKLQHHIKSLNLY